MRPAPKAAATPRMECSDPPCERETKDSNSAPTNMTNAPPSTPSHRNQPARCSSLNRSVPQMIAIKLFAFHKGKAILSPISRTALRNTASTFNFRATHMAARYERPVCRRSTFRRWGADIMRATTA